MESSNSHQGFPQLTWSYHTFKARKKCGEIGRSLYRRKHHLSSHAITVSHVGCFQENKDRPMEKDGEPIWAVGARKIGVNDLVLVRLDHVSKNSWQAQLQLLRPLHHSGD